MSEATDIRAAMDEFGDERLDYTKPPPGYVPHQFRGNFRGAPGAYSFAFEAPSGFTVSDTRFRTSEADAIQQCWAHYKREHDPPGMTVVHSGWYVDGRPSSLAQVESNMVLARAAAWAWHDRRHALAARLARGFTIVTGPTTSAFVQVWPGCLAWTDEQAAEVECHMQAENDAANQGRDSGSRWPAVLPQPYDPDEDSEVGALIEAHARDKAAQGRYADS